MMVDVSDLVGARFKPHGRSKEEGFDCYGLAIEVERRAGKNLPDAFYDGVDADSNRNTLSVLENGLPLENLDEPEDFCIVKMNESTRPHCGVYVGGGNVIHATQRLGVVIQKISRLHIDGYYRIVEK